MDHDDSFVLGIGVVVGFVLGNVARTSQVASRDPETRPTETADDLKRGSPVSPGKWPVFSVESIEPKHFMSNQHFGKPANRVRLRKA